MCVTGSKAVNFAIKASVQKGVGKTGESYAEFRAVVKTHLPEFMIIENLKELLVKVDGFDKSDAEYIEGDHCNSQARSPH